MPAPPRSEEELLARARALAGLTAAGLARLLGEPPPHPDPLRGKGRTGLLVERALGATAGSQDLPDFPHLGVELKTVPMDLAGHVLESTFVCSLDLERILEEEWETSRLWRKLRRVLFVPVQVAGPGSSPADRRLGTPLLWSPSPDELQEIRSDWHQTVGRIAVRGVEQVTAHHGTALQVRPKAASSAVRVEAPGPEGEPLRAVPRGFYLRARFTEGVLWRLSCPSPPEPGEPPAGSEGGAGRNA